MGVGGGYCYEEFDTVFYIYGADSDLPVVINARGRGCKKSFASFGWGRNTFQ